MELPYRALFMVREFSRPITRPDWKTCKKNESGIVMKHIKEQKQMLVDYDLAQERDMRQLEIDRRVGMFLVNRLFGHIAVLSAELELF